MRGVMMLDNEMAIVEAILLLENEPIDLEKIVKVSGLSPNVVPEVIDRLKEHYSGDSHGFDIAEYSGSFLLVPKQHLQEQLRDHYGKKQENKLSRAALETLAIIAYTQPVTRSEVENIRGVTADTMIRMLLKLNLIKETGKKDVPGKPVQYGTTKEFLSYFRLKSIADLPKLDETERAKFE
jgi:segregation and condensation protein B